MEIILYSRMSDANERQLLISLNHLDVEIFRSVGKLRKRLIAVTESRRVVILIIRGKTEIVSLSEWIPLFSDLMVIMILTEDKDLKIMTAAQKLRPEYIGFRDDDAMNLAAVLDRMRDRYQCDHKPFAILEKPWAHSPDTSCPASILIHE